MDGPSISLEGEDMIDGGLIWTPSTDAFHLDVNLARMLGLSDRGIVVDGAIFRACVHPADRERLRELGQAGLRARKPVRTTYSLRDRYGKFRDVRSDGFWIENEAGEVIATCQRIVEMDYASEARADKVAELALQIVKLVSGAEGQSAKALSEQIQIQLLRLDAEAMS